MGNTYFPSRSIFFWLFLLWLLLPYIINGWQCLIELNLKREGDREKEKHREKTHRKVERKAGRKAGRGEERKGGREGVKKE